MIDNFYLHQMMKKSDRKNYLTNKHGVFTITFPKKMKSNSRLKFIFKPGNTYVLKGEKLENIELSFPNSNVLVEGIEFNQCQINVEGGSVNYYCDNKHNSIATTKASKIFLSDYSDENFNGLPFTSEDLYLHNVCLTNSNNKSTTDILLRASQNIVLDNCKLYFNVLSNVLANPNQQIKISCDKLSMENSIISTILNKKSIKNNDNIGINDESYFSILVSSKQIELENSSIESGFNINVYSDNVILNKSLIGSIRNLEIDTKKIKLDNESDVVAIKPIFWETYISEYDINRSQNDILYCSERSLRNEKENSNNLFRTIEVLHNVKDTLTNEYENQNEKKNSR